MKIFSFKRLLGMAALYGIVRYVRASGGVKPAIDRLNTKARDLMDNMKMHGESGLPRPSSASAGSASDMGSRGDGRFGGQSSGVGSRGSSYASYDLDADDKLRH